MGLEVDLFTPMLMGTEFENYLLSPQHIQTIEELSALTSDSVEVTTPFDFVNVVLTPQHAKKVKSVVELSMTLPEIANFTAEEVFIGSCMLLCELSPHSNQLSPSMQTRFAGSMMGGSQVKTLLKDAMEAFS